MAGAIPDCRHVVIEGVGHMTAIEAPDRLSKEFLSFLQDHPLQQRPYRGFLTYTTVEPIPGRQVTGVYWDV